MTKASLDPVGIERFLEENRESMISVLSQLITIPSVREESQPGKPYGESCFNVLVKAEEIAREMGFTVRNFDNYCTEIGLPAGKASDGASIALFGHLDVVPAGEGWRYPPFQATRIADYIVGRGTVDDKGPVVALLFALKYFIRNRIILKNRIFLVLGCNEERGMDDMDYYLEHAPAPDISLVADDDFPVCHGEKGILRLDLRLPLRSKKIVHFEGGSTPSSVAEYARIELKGDPDRIDATVLPEGLTAGNCNGILVLEAAGRSAHSSAPQTGKNALLPIVTFVKTLELFPAEDEGILSVLDTILSDPYCQNSGIGYTDEISGSLSCCATMLRMKEQEVILSLDIRYPVTDRSERIKGAVTDLIKPAGGEYSVIFDSPPSIVKAESPLVQNLTELYNRMTGSHTLPYTMAGGTYARKIPGAVGFGAGNPEEKKPLGENYGDAHGPDEAVSLTTLEQAVRLYIGAISLFDQDPRKGDH